VHTPGVTAPGETMLIMCVGGPRMCQVRTFPPPLEIGERGGVYVLVDEGPEHDWFYEFVPAP
jgi:hypothetical protein